MDEYKLCDNFGTCRMAHWPIITKFWEAYFTENSISDNIGSETFLKFSLLWQDSSVPRLDMLFLEISVVDNRNPLFSKQFIFHRKVNHSGFEAEIFHSRLELSTQSANLDWTVFYNQFLGIYFQIQAICIFKLPCHQRYGSG